MPEMKRYVVALKQGLQALPDLHERLSSMEGVSVLGGSPRQVQVEATAEAAERITGEFSSHYYVEESVPRGPL
jgi:hypothetical protein